MPILNAQTDSQPTRAAIEALAGMTLLEFGASWCGHCSAARPHVEAALEHYPDVRHIKVEDGRGKPLGRSFRVKLWPTLVVLRDGEEIVRLVRPTRKDQVMDGLKSADAGGAD